MSIKLCLLKNQETVICDLKEVLDPEENKSVGYMMSDPFVVIQTNRGFVEVDKEQNTSTEPQETTIQFYRLFPLSNETNFKVAYEFIDVIYEPHNEIAQSYLNVLAKWREENVKTVDLSDSFLVPSGELDEEKTQTFLNQFEETREDKL